MLHEWRIFKAVRERPVLGRERKPGDVRFRPEAGILQPILAVDSGSQTFDYAKPFTAFTCAPYEIWPR